MTICTVYHEAEAACAAGGHTISVDEMTGIQALEHKYPSKPVAPEKAARMEFEYIRHGTTSLIDFFNVATGRLESPYLNPTRTEEDFVDAMRALVETDPEHHRHLSVMGRTHISLKIWLGHTTMQGKKRISLLGFYI